MRCRCFCLFLICKFPTSLVFMKSMFMLEIKTYSFKNGWEICDIIGKYLIGRILFLGPSI